jgi:uncharacterized protein YbjT (DUF2867 family)
MGKILVIGASGFLGKHLARALLADGHAVRGLARHLARVEDLAQAGCETVRGDLSDLASIRQAMEAVEAAYICVHTLSPQPAGATGQGFMDVEINGLEHIVTACRTHGVRRLIYVTFLGMTPDGLGEWTRGRWRAEQFLLNSGLDATVIRPGQIAGVGGHGFDMMVAQARKRVALILGGGQNKMRNIAVDDLVYYLVGVLNDPRTYGQSYNVGCDDVLTSRQMIDVAADVLGRPHPFKIPIPLTVLRVLTPLIERLGKLPRGAIRGLVDGLKVDLDADPTPIRAILPRPPLSYRQAVQRALIQEKS